MTATTGPGVVISALRDTFDLGMKNATRTGDDLVQVIAREDKALDIIDFLARNDARLVQQVGIDSGDRIELVDVFFLNHVKTRVLVRRGVDVRDNKVQTITGSFPCATWLEKYQATFLGIDFIPREGTIAPGDGDSAGEGLERVPWTRFELDDTVSKRDAGGATGIVDKALDHVSYTWVKSQQTRVSAVKLQAGHHHRGLVKFIEQAKLHEVPFIVSRSCWRDKQHATLAVALAIEQLAATPCTVPRVATWWRALACELERVVNHHAFIASWLGLAGQHDLARTVMNVNRLLGGLEERLADPSSTTPFIIPGGISSDPVASGRILPESFHDTLGVCSEFLEGVVIPRLGENGVFSRFKGVGVVPRRQAIAAGLCGPAARASGLVIDARRDFPCDAYATGLLRWDISCATGGDVQARVEVHVAEAVQSLRLLYQLESLVDESPGTEAINVQAGSLEGGKEAFTVVESSRGELPVYIKTSRDGAMLDTYRLRPPSFSNLAAIEQVVAPCHARLLPVIAHSFNPCWTCVDQ